MIFRQKATPLSSGSSAPPSLTRLPFSSARTSFSLGWWLQDTDGHTGAEDRDGERTEGEAAEDKDGRSSGHRQCQSDRLSIQSEDNRRSNKRESDKSKQ